MIGDYTKVPLRNGERWTGARMQQGRVLLDHEWNLNLDAAARTQQTEAYDVIGGAGVRERSDAFKVSFTSTGNDLSIAAGHIWVGGELAVAPAPFTYSSQPGIAPAQLPTSGKVLVYLDAFVEHVQPAEDPAELVDPALQPIDTSARTRIGYRVRIAPTTAANPRDAWRALKPTLVSESDAALSVAPAVAPAAADPCAPPGDPASLLPEGLLRVEVLDGGDPKTARFAWSFDNGASVAQVLAPPTTMSDVRIATTPSATFAQDDLVELSWLGRRADRGGHGELYKVKSVTAKQDGTHLELTRTTAFAAPPSGAEGLVIRRWDGESTPGDASSIASYRGRDYATITPGATGTYRAGDWWGARIRNGGVGIEQRTSATSDGVAHAFVQLALVDLGAKTVIDMRPRFRPLVDLSLETCTVALDPDSDLETEIAFLPSDGGEICFAAGRYELTTPLVFTNKHRVVLHGSGPASVIVAPNSSETALRFENCTQIELRNLQIVGGAPSPGSGALDGALTFVGACTDVRVEDCVLRCADASALTRTCLTVRSDGTALPDVVRVARSSFEIGANQAGILLVDVDEARVDDNRLALSPTASQDKFARQGIVVAGGRASIVEIGRNIIREVAQGIHVALSDTSGNPLKIDKALVTNNMVWVKIPKGFNEDRHAILVGRANSIQILGNAAKLDPAAIGTAISGVRVKAPEGPMMMVRDTALDGFDVGVAVTDVDPNKIPQQRVWHIEGTMAANGNLALDAPLQVTEEHNAPMPVGGKLKPSKGVTVTPVAVAPGTSAAGTVELDGPAGRGGATIALSVVKANAQDQNVATVPQSVVIPAGARTAPFTVSVPAQALQTGVNVTIHAEHQYDPNTLVKSDAAFTVLGKTTVKTLTLSQSSILGAANAKITGTVELTQADQSNVIVNLGSDHPSAANPAAASITIPAGTTSKAFDILVSSVANDQPTVITADLNGGARSATVTVQAAPLLKIGRIRILNVASDTDTTPTVLFDTNQAGSGFLPSRVISLDYDPNLGTDEYEANAIEVQFTNAPLNGASVVAGSSFFVVRQGTNVTAPTNQRIAVLSNNTVRWVAGSIPLSPLGTTAAAMTTSYTVTLKGTGNSPIKSSLGKALDGELTGLPSGNNQEGGDATFTLSLKRVREIVDKSDSNDHIGRAHPDDYVP